MTPKCLTACVALALAAAPWAAAELVEVVADGLTVATIGSNPATIPEYFDTVSGENALELVAVFDTERDPLEQTATSATYEALYGYGTVNGAMIPLSGITLRVVVGTEDNFGSFTLQGTAPGGWRMWVDGFSEDPAFCTSTDFPVAGFVEPEGDFYRRCDIGANGVDWDAFTDQIILPRFTLIEDEGPVPGEWYNLPFASQYGTFTLSYDATPSALGIDGVTGLSRAPADFFTDLALTVRFAPSGWIDARNGSVYQATQPLRYVAGVSYHVEIRVDLWARRYSATVTPAGGSPVVVARDFAFRTEHARATELAHLSYYAVNGVVEVRNLELHRPANGTLFSAGTWENAPLPVPNGAFTVEYVVTPSRGDLDAVTGLALGEADWFTDLAAIVRFAPNGKIDARDDNQYRAANSLKYKAGVKYLVRLTVDPARRRYSATVKPDGGSAKKIADNYRFRREQAGVVGLDTFALFSNGGGATEVTGLTVK